jgi:hypothetical protein
MTAPLQTKWAKGIVNAPAPRAAEVCAVRYVHTLLTGQNVTGRIIEMGPLPAGCVVVDMILDADDLDTDGSPAVTIDVGLMSGSFGDPDPDGARTLGTEFFAASTVGQAGGLVRPTAKGAVRTTKSDVDRGIGIKIATQADVAQEGDIGDTVLYRQGD